jgi:multiple sugar transport system substrate-binding protein
MGVRPFRYRIFALTTTALLAVPLIAACGSGSGGVPVINLYNAPQENIASIVSRCNQEAAGKYRIVLNTLPRGADGQREQLVRRLAAADSGLDVLGLDVTWTPELAQAGWIKEWTGNDKQQAENGTLPGPLQTATWQDKLYAAPYNTNVQLLWYRSDLMPNPPSTWSQLITQAGQLASAGKPHYVEVTGAQYEGLVVWFNSLVASAGGQILNDAGTAVSLGAPATTALGVMRDFARSPAADPSLTNTMEDAARLAMESGTAVAEINWPFVYASMAANKPDLLPNFKWAPWPGIDGTGKSPLGGANFAVSNYSKHPEQAFAAALCLRDPTSQLTAAVKDGLPPTIQSVYADPQMAKTYPMRDAILAALETAAPRPQTPTYQNVSTTISAILSPPRSIDPTRTLRTLNSQISDALQSKGVLP